MWSGRQREPRLNFVDLDKLHVCSVADLANYGKKLSPIMASATVITDDLSPKMRTATMPRGASVDDVGGVGGFPKFVLIGT